MGVMADIAAGVPSGWKITLDGDHGKYVADGAGPRGKRWAAVFEPEDGAGVWTAKLYRADGHGGVDPHDEVRGDVRRVAEEVGERVGRR